jgi:hypothetical protein
MTDDPKGTSPFHASAAEANPYASPQSSAGATERPSGPWTELRGIEAALAGTRPWVIFLSVLGFIGSGFLVLGTVGVSITALTMRGNPGMLVVAVLYLLMAAFGMGASYYLFTYGRRIGDYLSGGDLRDLEEALFTQKSFWKLWGIGAVMYLGLVALGFVTFLLVGFAG